MWQRVLRDKKILGILGVLVLVAAVPLTLKLGQQAQDVRQHAAESTPPVCSETGTDNILIIDKSNSMNVPSSPTDPTTKFDRAKQAAKSFADILASKNAAIASDRQHKLSVVSFSNSILTKMEVNLTTDMNLVKQQIDTITPGDDQTGWTCIECGLKNANTEFNSTRQRSNLKNVAILLTDGKANWLDGGTTSVSQATAEQKATDAALSGFTNSQTMYFTIGLGNSTEINEAFLKNIATKTGASYYHAPTATDLQGIYTQISQVLGKGTVSGMVYHDVNANKVFDTGEQMLPNWTINLLNGSTTQATTSTDSTGVYSFTNVCDGAYHVKPVIQSTWTLTDPANSDNLAVTILGGNTVLNQQFGVKQEAQRTSLSCSPSTLTLTDVGQPITATLKDSNGNLISGRTIIWSKNGEQIQINPTSSTTGSNGTTTTNTLVTDAEASFNGSVTAVFAGDSNNAPSSCNVTTQFTPKSTTLSFKVFLHGLGNSGDNANPTNSSLSTKNPLRKTRNLTVSLYNLDNVLVKQATSQSLSFDSSQGAFNTTINLGQGFQSGKYTVKVHSDGFLVRQLPGILTLTANQNTTLPVATLVTGDINNDNKLDILDYNQIIDCYSDYLPPVSCTSEQKIVSDITDDGKVDHLDNNLFDRELSVQFGD